MLVREEWRKSLTSYPLNGRVIMKVNIINLFLVGILSTIATADVIDQENWRIGLKISIGMVVVRKNFLISEQGDV